MVDFLRDLFDKFDLLIDFFAKVFTLMLEVLGDDRDHFKVTILFLKRCTLHLHKLVVVHLLVAVCIVLCRISRCLFTTVDRIQVLLSRVLVRVASGSFDQMLHVGRTRLNQLDHWSGCVIGLDIFLASADQLLLSKFRVAVEDARVVCLFMAHQLLVMLLELVEILQDVAQLSDPGPQVVILLGSLHACLQCFLP